MTLSVITANERRRPLLRQEPPRSLFLRQRLGQTKSTGPSRLFSLNWTKRQGL